MKNYILVFLFLSMAQAVAQKNATDPLYVPTPYFSKSLDTMIAGPEPTKGLVSRPSFKRIFEKDFATLTGTNTLPVNQLILSLNQPEIQVGQLINVYANDKKSIPFLGIYPYIKGKLNKNNEFRVFKKGDIDPGVDFGGKLVFNVYGLSKNTGYYYIPKTPEVSSFLMKTNAVKALLEHQYSEAELKKRIGDLEKNIEQSLYEIDSLQAIDPGKQLLIAQLQEKVYKDQVALKPLQEMVNNESKRLKYIAEKVYEAEKDAPWSFRKFIYLTLEGNTGNQTFNIYRNNAIEEDQNFRKNTLGISANYASFGKHGNMVLYAKYDRSFTNQFLSDDAITLVSDSLLSGTKYKISESKEVFNVNGLSDVQFNKKSAEDILSLGATYLSSKGAKLGATVLYKSNLSTKVANLRIGGIVPVTLDKSDAKPSNIIIELVLPDLYTQEKTNIKNKEKNGDTVWNRAYVNLKVGIPINLL
ncbi:hypothetical protein CLV98_10312 [Dyadobacter jejuensis]|uniref:Uncharacterized protein n=1 Tax=Dyadobacter jejuensis TaxID=1082580 RepID=A0A316B7R1_9BACT|nr:hypothetical protein [Dyadobacter jejuensis]PWJ58647.1 hypothetical protein CLV98_10312 [Dyadobacter jejuensis]